MEDNVKKIVRMQSSDAVREYTESNVEEYWRGKYTGKVVDNNDPDKVGKCKIRVFGIFGSEIQDKDLPWALPEFQFVGSKVGSFVVPPVGAIVRVYFDRGEIYLPVYTTKVIDENNLPTQRNTDYPDNMVLFESDDGDYFTINRKSKVAKYKHNSGVEIIIDKNGKVTIEGTQGKNSLSMDTNGVKVNGKFLVTEDFLQDLLVTFASALGMGNYGLPVPIYPSTLTAMLQKYNITPDQYLTNKTVGG